MFVEVAVMCGVAVGKVLHVDVDCFGEQGRVPGGAAVKGGTGFVNRPGSRDVGCSAYGGP